MGSDYPDGSKLSIIRGWTGTEFKNIKVADDGTMYILVSALTDSTLIPLKSDSLGNLLLNIKAQDLAEVINRPKYGAAQRVSGTVVVDANETKDLVEVIGKGIIYGGRITIAGQIPQYQGRVKFYVDSVQVGYEQFLELQNYGRTSQWTSILFITRYEIVTGYYQMCISSGITFESGFKLTYEEKSGNSADPSYQVWYALV